MSILRCVILRHEGIADPHFDLMFETAAGSELSTWRSDRWPIIEPTPLIKLADHRSAYLEYEGPISGDRGSVRRIISGHYQLHECDDKRWRLSFPKSIGSGQLVIESEQGQWLARPIGNC